MFNELDEDIVIGLAGSEPLTNALKCIKSSFDSSV